MYPPSLTHRSKDSSQSPLALGQANPWFRLFITMAVPVLLLLIALSLSR